MLSLATVTAAGGTVRGPDSKHLCPVPMLTLFKERGERGLMVPEFQPGTLAGNDEDFPGKVRTANVPVARPRCLDAPT